MSTITKERAELKAFITSFLSDPAHDDKTLNSLTAEVFRIALASLEAEAVAFVMAEDLKDSSIISTPAYRDFGEAMERTVGDVVALYAAHPAPVSVPAAYEKNEDFSAYHEGWNACRAAMLQGAENVESLHAVKAAPLLDSSAKGIELQHADFQSKDDGNSSVIPDCSCRTCRPVTFSDSRFVVCPECGNKRCPHANDHRNACTGSNEPGQEGSAYPAAPQQEVKP